MDILRYLSPELYPCECVIGKKPEWLFQTETRHHMNFGDMTVQLCQHISVVNFSSVITTKDIKCVPENGGHIKHMIY
jgi:hypothetical protein